MAETSDSPQAATVNVGPDTDTVSYKAASTPEVDQATDPHKARLWLSTLLFVLSGLAACAMFGFWFVGIWTHGHDASSRMSATGFLAAVVAGVFAVLGAVARGAKR